MKFYLKMFFIIFYGKQTLDRKVHFWQEYLDPVDVLHVLHCNGDLFSTMKTSIYFLGSFRSRNSAGALVLVDGDMHGRCTFSAIVKVLGPSLQELSLNGNVFSSLYLNVLICANLRSFSLIDKYNEFDVRDILRLRSGQLRSLDFKRTVYLGLNYCGHY